MEEGARELPSVQENKGGVAIFLIILTVADSEKAQTNPKKALSQQAQEMMTIIP